jgi:hypothetical protein
MQEILFYDENGENPRPLSLLTSSELTSIARGDAEIHDFLGSPDEEIIGRYVAGVLLRERTS